MRLTNSVLSLAGAVAVAASLAWAGGMWVQVGNPAASPEATQLGAVLTVRAVGCHQPADMKISATAITKSNAGLKKTDLKLIPMKEAGLYAVRQEWSAGENTVLQFVGTDRGYTTTSLVPANAAGIQRNRVQSAMKPPSETEVAQMLDDLQNATSARVR